MTDMTAFERHVADEMLRRAGPIRKVDDLAVWDAVIVAKRSRHQGFTISSALKFVAAGVIVALFGGFLLSGFLTPQQSDELAPAAATESWAPEARNQPTQAPTTSVRTDIVPGVALSVEEVEPRVFRVVNDGVRSLSPTDTYGWKQGVMASDDSSIWLVGERWFARLGDEMRHDLPSVKSIYGGLSPRDIEFATDGTAWAITVGRNAHDPGILRSYDGQRWTRRSPKQGIDVAEVEVGPDGTVWASWTMSGQKDRTYVGTVGPDGLERVAVTDGSPGLQGLVITRDGDLMLRLDMPHSGTGSMRVGRYVDGSWQEMAVDGAGLTALGPDGSVWMLSAVDAPYFDESGTRYERAIPLDSLVLFDGDVHRVWQADEGLPAFASTYHVRGDMRVAPDGGLWISYPYLAPSGSSDGESEVRYDGIAYFDGTAWQRFLRGRVVEILDIAADGSVWLRIDDGDVRDLYVITPEAVAAAG